MRETELQIHHNELSKIQHDVNQMRQEFVNLKIDLREENVEFSKKLDRLLTLMEGDPADPKRGFINRMIEMENFLADIKSTKSYLAGNVAAIILIASFLGTLFSVGYKIYELFVKK